MAHAERVAPDRLELTVRPEMTELRELILLAQREKACCRFFDFSLHVEADMVTFVVCVPVAAADLLDDVATLTIRP
ncbi:MAG: hypothetical protein M3137_20330 [Actinomycetota bacterium]|nr:hypothetical protein [Actinomycetota bacterium]